MKKLSRHPFFIRLFNWEYWPFHVVYGPLYFYWLWICLKARSFFFFTASNPSIQYGGFLMESKMDIYNLMPPSFYPRTIFIPAFTPAESVLQQINSSQLSFPLIGKPDIGGRGRGVKKLNNNNEVIGYASVSKLDYMIQEFVPFELEAGIFYYRIPGEATGHISGIVFKEFLAIVGDGKSTMRHLLMQDQRSILQLKVLQKTMKHELNSILPKGEKKVLVPYGNHCRGAKFMDVSYLINDHLSKAIDHVCKQIDGFYFGRMDIRFESWESLARGEKFSIIELNGSGSEPTHIYDSNHSIFYAWKEIIRHWDILYIISKKNKNNYPYMGFKDGVKMFRDNNTYEKVLSKTLY